MPPAQDSHGVLASASRTTSNIDQLTSSAASLTATDLTPEVKVFGPLGFSSRWAWTIGGSSTPTFEFSVTPVTANRDN